MLSQLSPEVNSISRNSSIEKRWPIQLVAEAEKVDGSHALEDVNLLTSSFSISTIASLCERRQARVVRIMVSVASTRADLFEPKLVSLVTVIKATRRDAQGPDKHPAS